MPKYKYVALDLDNKKVSAFVDAKDERDFRMIMRSQHLVPVSFKVVRETKIHYRMKSNEVAEFARQLSSMLSSGVTVLRAIDIMKDRDLVPGVRQLYDTLHKDIQGGATMSEAMRNQPGVFPELLINMCASGEASGKLDQVVGKMADHYNKEHRLSGKVKAAMMYPMILAVITVLVVMLIFTVVLPPLFEILQGVQLPLITKIVLAISDFLQANWLYTIIGVLVLITVAGYLKTIYAVAYNLDKLKLKIPTVGKLLTIIYTARFARTLSTLYSSGIAIIQALEISSTIVGNKYVQAQFDEVITEVRNGEPLSSAVLKVDGFDTKLAHSILVGEESGHLDEMLISTADSFDYEAEAATGRLVQLIEPVMLVVMAVIIGSIVLAVMLPVMTLYQNMGTL